MVILIDEYDKPLLQTLQNEALLDDYRRTLNAFYGVLKSSDRYLCFAFLTGMTKNIFESRELKPLKWKAVEKRYKSPDAVVAFFATTAIVWKYSIHRELFVCGNI